MILYFTTLPLGIFLMFIPVPRHKQSGMDYTLSPSARTEEPKTI
jgi:hypothetical protein